MTWYLDLPTQVRRFLPIRFGGTGNNRGYSRAVVIPASNGGADTIPVGSIVRMGVVNRVSMVTDPAATDVIGVTVGRFEPNGEDFVVDEAEVGENAAVAVYGIVPVRIDPAAAAQVNPGDYAVPAASGEPGCAEGVVVPTSAVFGRFVGGGTPGDVAPVKIGGGGGGGGSVFPLDGACEVHFDLCYAGQEVATKVPFDGDIVGWYIAGDVSGNAVVDVYGDGTYRPGSGDTIVASDPPTLSSADDATGSASGWTTALTKGDWLVFHIDSVATIQYLVVGVIVERTS